MVVKKNSKSKIEIPVIVKIIAVFGYIGSALLFILGLAIIFGASAIAAIFAKYLPHYALLGAGALIVIGLFLVILAVLFFFVSRGLWRGQRWARIIAIILSGIGVISALFSFRIFSLILNLAVCLYLLLSKEVKAAFGN